MWLPAITIQGGHKTRPYRSRYLWGETFMSSLLCLNMPGVTRLRLGTADDL
jgi:hypothetical protein